MSLGAAFHLVAQFSILPLIVMLIYYFFGWLLIVLTQIGKIWERKIYTYLSSVGFVVAGLSGIYRTYFGDLQGDASGFFNLITHVFQNMPLSEMSIYSEGALWIKIMQKLFDFMSIIKFPKEQYVGILFNSLIVSLTGVVAMKMARLLYGDDVYRFKRLIILFSFCGMMWLFSGILIRDCLALFAASILLYFWLVMMM